MDLPKIVEMDRFANGVELTLFVDKELDVFEGHFDSMPILAGVIQVNWAITLCCKYLQVIPAKKIDCLESLKFLKIIVPGIELQLKLEIKNNKLIFSFSSEHEKYSSGKIVLVKNA